MINCLPNLRRNYYHISLVINKFWFLPFVKPFTVFVYVDHCDLFDFGFVPILKNHKYLSQNFEDIVENDWYWFR